MKTDHFFTLKMHIILLISAILFNANTFINAEVRLPQILSSDMVLQRNGEIKIWGWADRGETVRVTFNNITRTARTSKDGKWSVIFPAMKEGGPLEMIVGGKSNSITLKNILIGDVWVCSGQSNMAWTVSNSVNPEEEIKLANYPEIRLLTIPRTAQLAVSDDVPQTEWLICSPENIPSFSAVGYFFGRHVHKESGIPIGLINTSWGGTNVEAWTSVDFMKGMDEYTEKLKFLDISTPEGLKRAEALRIKMLEDNFNITAGILPSDNWADPQINLSNWRDMNIPGYWEARYLSGIDGVVWFRKEINLDGNEASGEFILNLGKIDDSDITWVNGTEIGRTINQSDKNRSYKISRGILKPGKNVIVVKVTDQQGNGGFGGAAADMNLTGNNLNTPLAGTWKYRLSGENLKYTHTSFPPNDIPSQLFNGMIYPLLNLKVSGSIWYQGESNAGRAYRYRTLFPLMINNWRTYWNQPDMPFIFVQLANYKAVKPEPGESDWAELREAQLMTLSLPNTGMAVIIDIGEENDIHPRNKQDVGYRLALNALKLAYGKNVVSMGPLYRSMEKSGNKIILSFDHTGSGLMSKDKYGYLKGFSIAGSNKEFHWAKAYLEGNKVVVYSDDISSPVAVRYGWADNPDDVNLYNIEGLPASPFRTDDWKGITEGK